MNIEDKQYVDDEVYEELNYYTFHILTNHDERDETLIKNLERTLQHWKEVFNDEELLLYFIRKFNEEMPEFCHIEYNPVQQDLFN